MRNFKGIKSNSGKLLKKSTFEALKTTVLQQMEGL